MEGETENPSFELANAGGFPVEEEENGIGDTD